MCLEHLDMKSDFSVFSRRLRANDEFKSKNMLRRKNKQKISYFSAYQVLFI